MKEASGRRFLLVLLVSLAIIALTGTHLYGLALALGILVGAGFFLRGMATGGGLGNARGFGQANPDIHTRIGVALAAAGIAAGAIGQPQFPMSFRIFYGLCLGLGCCIALVIAGRSLHKP